MVAQKKPSEWIEIKLEDIEIIDTEWVRRFEHDVDVLADMVQDSDRLPFARAAANSMLSLAFRPGITQDTYKKMSGIYEEIEWFVSAGLMAKKAGDYEKAGDLFRQSGAFQYAQKMYKEAGLEKKAKKCTRDADIMMRIGKTSLVRGIVTMGMDLAEDSDRIHEVFTEYK